MGNPSFAAHGARWRTEQLRRKRAAGLDALGRGQGRGRGCSKNDKAHHTQEERFTDGSHITENRFVNSNKDPELDSDFGRHSHEQKGNRKGGIGGLIKQTGSSGIWFRLRFKARRSSEATKARSKRLVVLLRFFSA